MDLNQVDIIVIDDLPRMNRPRRRRRSSPVEERGPIIVPPTSSDTDPGLRFTSEHDKPTIKGAAIVIIFTIIAIILVFALGCGTTTMAQGEIVTGNDYEIRNVHRLAPKLPERLRRVAILPLTVEASSPNLNSGRDSLEPVLQSELDRLNVFEVIRVSPEQLRILTGARDWATHEELPPTLLSTIKKQFGVDAVLFSRLTRYHAYPPMAVGWNMKLVDANDGQVWWAADEMFDQADPRVATSSRRYSLKHQKYHQANPLLADSRTALISPRRLAQYSVAALFETLPER